eukprot:gb/GECH01014044.1/.p1 GENE.gb/GECH01014044.1/~~gb/GECH01014044.1/.p1  ORF type:complete len:168 (+),score=48.04 gb/GECH01014044.1/:1-504(+)
MTDNDNNRTVKGRGGDSVGITAKRVKGDFEDLDVPMEDAAEAPLKSIEGWVIIVTNVHEEATEEYVYDKFCEFGEVSNIHLNVDRRTGFVKGYALLEFKRKQDAESAIKEMNGASLAEQKISVDWAFRSGPLNDTGDRYEKSDRRLSGETRTASQDYDDRNVRPRRQ